MNPKEYIVNEQIFREYDIRGVVGVDLTPEVVENLGRAVGTYLLRNGVTEMTLGRDCRLSSDSLNDELCRGLLATGINVIDIGVCHTPLLYFSLFHLDKNGGVMITGSHNPPEFNGFKVCLGKATIYGEEIKALEKLIRAHDFEKGAGKIFFTGCAAGVLGPDRRRYQLATKAESCCGRGKRYRRPGGSAAPAAFGR